MDETNPQSPKLLDRVRNLIRLKNYAYSTEKTYVYWIRRFILFHHKRHPSTMDAPEIEAFLTHLAVNENVAASTQNQALCALIFLFNQVLHQDLCAHPADVGQTAGATACGAYQGGGASSA